MIGSRRPALDQGPGVRISTRSLSMPRKNDDAAQVEDVLPHSELGELPESSIARAVDRSD